MTHQMPLFANDQDLRQQRWREIDARKRAIHAQANRAASEAYSAWFRERAREMGGIDPQTRPIVIDECKRRADKARRQVFINHGYTICGHDTTGTDRKYQERDKPINNQCQLLVTPGFTACPDHSPVHV